MALLVLAAVIAGVVVFVSRGGSGSRPAAHETGVNSAQPHSWRVAMHAVSQPAPVHGRFVVYAAARGGLDLVGLDANSGRTEWTVHASPSAIAPGTPPKLAVVGNEAVYLEAVGGMIARVAAINADTGVTLWHSAPGAFSDWPAVCPDDATAVCVSGELQDGSSAGVLHFDAATGRVLPASRLGPGARELTADLFDVGQRHPELLVATRGSAVAWQQPLHTIFTLPGSSTDYGWNFDRIPHLGLYIGSVGAPPLVQTRTRYAVDLSKAMTAGFRISDGAPVWRDPGSQYLCGYLACPGAINPAYSSIADANTSGPTVGLRLRADGVLSGTPSSIGATASNDARGALEGFDPATGHLRWTFDFGRDVGLLTQTQLPPRTSTHSIVLRTPTGRPIVLDVLTGRKRSSSGVAFAWCSKIVSYHMTVPYRAGGRSSHDYVGQYAFVPCTPTGRPVAIPSRGTAAMKGLVAETHGEFAWMEQGAVVAVPA